MDPHLNAAFFGANSMKHLFEIEERKKFLVDRPRRRKRRDKKGGGNSIECNFKINCIDFGCESSNPLAKPKKSNQWGEGDAKGFVSLSESL